MESWNCKKLIERRKLSRRRDERTRFFFECYTEEYAKDAYIFMDIPWPETCMA